MLAQSRAASLKSNDQVDVETPLADLLDGLSWSTGHKLFIVEEAGLRSVYDYLKGCKHLAIPPELADKLVFPDCAEC